MKKIFFLILLMTLFLPFTSLALGGSYTITTTDDSGTTIIYHVNYDGLVPCGKCVNINPRAPASMNGECNQTISQGELTNRKAVRCILCHLFVAIDGIIDFVLLTIVPPIGTLLLIFAGFSFYQAMGNPEKLTRAKSLLLSAIIGLTIIYTSWIVINTTLDVLGIADWVGFGEGWFQINCELKTTNL